MRLKMYFTLENENVPIDYRRSILSFIKLSLSEYNQEYYERLYKDNVVKPYAFSVFFKSPKIESEKIFVEDKRFELNLTVEDYEIAIVLYNSFNKQKHKTFSIYQNSFVLQDIVLVPEKEIVENKILVKFQSPLCARERIDNKDYYYSYEKEKFKTVLRLNLEEQLKRSGKSLELLNSFDIIPIKPIKVVIKFYEKQIECSTGTFELQGNKELLEYLYKAGMGSKHSAGFGMFQIK